MSFRTPAWLCTALICATALIVVMATQFGSARATVQYAQQCSDPYTPMRNPSNPLMLPRAPGANPLSGANLFVNGPRHGYAASAIATLLGMSPSSFPASYSWAQLQASLYSKTIEAQLLANPKLATNVKLLEKLAREPEAQKFSLYAGGGGPGAIFRQVQKIFCSTLTADPGAIPIITTFFLYQDGYCETRAEILKYRPQFERQIDEMVAGIGNRPAIMLLEIDGIGSSKCMMVNGGLGAWETDMRYEIQQVAALPHTVVYIEAGFSDGNSPAYTAHVLNAVGVGKVRGFFTNDTHNEWTINEIRWADKVSKLTGGAHFVVNTATNGRGPLLNPHPATQGVEDLCNPPGRGIGPQPTTKTGFPRADAFLWTAPPGISSGLCNGGTKAGTFWLERALLLSSLAQDKLGPRYPSDPY